MGLIDQIRRATNANYALGSDALCSEVEVALGRRATLGVSDRPLVIFQMIILTSCPATDQRSEPRSQDVCDISAFDDGKGEQDSFFVVPLPDDKAVVLSL